MTLNRKIFQNIPNRHPDKIMDVTNETVMADLKVGLPSDQGYKGFLCVKNITSGQVDAEPIKDKTSAEVARAFEAIWRRKEILRIQGTRRIITDLGGEFMGAPFRDFCTRRRITLIPYNLYHHNSTAIIERAIGVITKLMLEELNHRSLHSRRNENAWMPLLQPIVKEMNKHAKPRHTLADTIAPPKMIPNLHPLGLEVHKRLPVPVHLLNGRQKFKFRNGDRRFSTHKSIITDYRVRFGGRPISYILDNDHSIAYQHHEVLPAT